MNIAATNSAARNSRAALMVGAREHLTAAAASALLVTGALTLSGVVPGTAALTAAAHTSIVDAVSSPS